LREIYQKEAALDRKYCILMDVDYEVVKQDQVCEIEDLRVMYKGHKEEVRKLLEVELFC